MKKFEGMMPPTLVLADAGKNGDFGPPPSMSGLNGGTIGFTILWFGSGKPFRYPIPSAGRTNRRTTATAKPFLNCNQPSSELELTASAAFFHINGINASTPSPAAMM